MNKKINTPAIIKSIITDSKTSGKVLEEIKQERFPDTAKKSEGLENSDNKNIVEENPTTEPIAVDIETEETATESINKGSESGLYSEDTGLLKSETRLWTEFNKILDAEFYGDKKTTFQMSLSGQCLLEYEKIANGVTYKTGKKAKRNDVIRKVLEDYIHNKKNTLDKIIEKL